MLKKTKKDEKIDITKLNDVISLSKNILKIVYVLIAIMAAYIIIKLFKELNIKETVIIILKNV